MKYICLGYYDEKQWATMSESERNAYMDECFAYDDVLKKNGHFAGGEALQGAGVPRPCAGRTARCPSPTARSRKPRNSWAES